VLELLVGNAKQLRQVAAMVLPAVPERDEREADEENGQPPVSALGNGSPT
jgi:hypothetical protein